DVVEASVQLRLSNHSEEVGGRIRRWLKSVWMSDLPNAHRLTCSINRAHDREVEFRVLISKFAIRTPQIHRYFFGSYCLERGVRQAATCEFFTLLSRPGAPER